MSDDSINKRLSRIKTRWTMVAQAHQGQGDEAMAAQRHLLLCYYRSVYHYLRGMVRDSDVAEELTHEFSVRFLRGDFKRADPGRGRFRDLVKTAARNLALDYWRRETVRKKKGPHALAAEHESGRHSAPLGDLLLPTPETEAVFIRQWRQALMGRAWKMLARLQKETGSAYFTLLRFKTKHPRVGSQWLAQKLGARLGRACTAAGVRQILRRAREKFADYLVAEVARSMPAASLTEIADELREVRLHPYCQAALHRFAQRRRRR